MGLTTLAVETWQCIGFYLPCRDPRVRVKPGKKLPVQEPIESRPALAVTGEPGARRRDRGPDSAPRSVEHPAANIPPRPRRPNVFAADRTPRRIDGPGAQPRHSLLLR